VVTQGLLRCAASRKIKQIQCFVLFFPPVFAEEPSKRLALKENNHLLKLVSILVLISLAGVGARAEETSAPPAETEKPLRQQLAEKLVKRDGIPASIVVFKSVENETSSLGLEMPGALEAAMKTFGPLNVRKEDYALPAVTMEEIRLAMARYDVDVLIAPVVKPASVDLFLFDRRMPYSLFAHSEPVTSELYDLPKAQAAKELTRRLIRRILFRYLKNQSFELPRQETLPVLRSEIPQWVASQDSLNLVNRELKSRFYLNASLGGAFSMGISSQLWNSNMVSLQVGVRLWKKFHFEGQLSAFSYNALVTSFRYTFLNRDSPFRINVGLGFAFVTRDKVWNLDQTIGLGRYSQFFVASGSLLFPIGEVYLKLESQVFIAPSFNQYIWTVMPGLQVHF
jgi:hypothetical protein